MFCALAQEIQEAGLQVLRSDRHGGLQLLLQASASPLVLQGERGLSRKSAAPGNASYYYSLTRLPTRGELRIGEARYTVKGDSWMDREWSGS